MKTSRVGFADRPWRGGGLFETGATFTAQVVAHRGIGRRGHATGSGGSRLMTHR